MVYSIVIVVRSHSKYTSCMNKLSAFCYCVSAHFYQDRLLDLLFYSCQLIWQQLDRHQGLISLLGRGWNIKVTGRAVSPMALSHCAHGSASHLLPLSLLYVVLFASKCCAGHYLGATQIPAQRVGGRGSLDSRLSWSWTVPGEQKSISSAVSLLWCKSCHSGQFSFSTGCTGNSANFRLH